MLTLVAGSPSELEELERDYAQLGVPSVQVQAATYESLAEIPPDDLADRTIIFELSTSTPGTWKVLTQLRRIAPHASLTLMYRGTPSDAVEAHLQERASAMKASLMVVSAANPQRKTDRMRQTVAHLV